MRICSNTEWLCCPRWAYERTVCWCEEISVELYICEHWDRVLWRSVRLVSVSLDLWDKSSDDRSTSLRTHILWSFWYPTGYCFTYVIESVIKQIFCMLLGQCTCYVLCCSWEVCSRSDCIHIDTQDGTAVFREHFAGTVVNSRNLRRKDTWSSHMKWSCWTPVSNRYQYYKRLSANSFTQAKVWICCWDWTGCPRRKVCVVVIHSQRMY